MERSSGVARAIHLCFVWAILKHWKATVAWLTLTKMLHASGGMWAWWNLVPPLYRIEGFVLTSCHLLIDRPAQGPVTRVTPRGYFFFFFILSILFVFSGNEIIWEWCTLIALVFLQQELYPRKKVIGAVMLSGLDYNSKSLDVYNLFVYTNFVFLKLTPGAL